MTPEQYWRSNSQLQEITPKGERFPEVGLFDALGIACSGMVFEFGCGDGRLSPAFNPSDYLGYDINPAALTAARKANPKHRYTEAWVASETFLAHTVLLHVPDDLIQGVIDKAKSMHRRIVIGEVMGRKWRRGGNPPVFNREVSEYVQMVGVEPLRIAVAYPRYGCDLDMLVFDGY
jgi:SAM-dependent methyltransferase